MTVPFTLSYNAAKRFTEMTFHRCTKTGFDNATNRVTYECDYTYFFLDRPVDSVLVIPEEVFQKDSEALLAGNLKRNILPGSRIDDVLKNGVPFDEDFAFIKNNHSTACTSRRADLSPHLIPALPSIRRSLSRAWSRGLLRAGKDGAKTHKNVGTSQPRVGLGEKKP